MLECKDELVETFAKYFECAKEHVVVFPAKLDLSQLDLFKVIKDG